MIYFARTLSLVGGVATLFGIAMILFMTLLELREWIPSSLQDQWMLLIALTALSGLVLMIGQLCGNDLFKVRGKDSIIALREDPDRDILNDHTYPYY